MYSTPKFCIDCKFYNHLTDICGHQEAIYNTNLITGVVQYKKAPQMRYTPTLCDTVGSFFEPRPPVEPNVIVKFWKKLNERK